MAAGLAGTYVDTEAKLWVALLVFNTCATPAILSHLVLPTTLPRSSIVIPILQMEKLRPREGEETGPTSSVWPAAVSGFEPSGLGLDQSRFFSGSVWQFGGCANPSEPLLVPSRGQGSPVRPLYHAACAYFSPQGPTRP